MEIPQYIEKPFLSYKATSIWHALSLFLSGQPILDTEYLRQTIRSTIGDYTFKEIHDKFKWNLNISITDSKKHDESRLLNYLTTPNVVIWTAVCASSAIPHFFEAGELKIKNEYGEIIPYHPNVELTRFIDGSIGSDLPMQRMSELFNVNTFIVSQVNPHVVPFVAEDGGGILEIQGRRRFVNVMKALVGNEMKNFLTQLITLGLLPITLQRASYFIT